MNRSDLIKIVAQCSGFPKTRIKAVFDVLFSSMTEALARGERVEIKDFGIFKVHPYAAHLGRNPRTGVTVWVPVTRLAAFKPGKAFRRRMARALAATRSPDPVAEQRRFDPSRAAFLDAPERKQAIPPEQIILAVRPEPGMAIADLGTGTGYFLWPLVLALGGQGTFYGLDSSDVMLEHLRARAASHPSGDRVTPVLVRDGELPLPAASLDRLVLGSVYHELPHRSLTMATLRALLRPGGEVVIIDWRPLGPGQERVMGPPADHRVSEAEAHQELVRAGYRVRGLACFEQLWTLIAQPG